MNGQDCDQCNGESESCTADSQSSTQVKMESVPEESVVVLKKTESHTTINRDCFDGADSRRGRYSHKPRRVPNLLAGPALLPGPVTPNFAPSSAPEFPDWCVTRIPQVAIFPQFMIAPSLTDGESDDKITFVREAMEKAVGLPPLIFEPSQIQVDTAKDRKNQRRGDRSRRECLTSRPQRNSDKNDASSFKSSEGDFPTLDSVVPDQFEITTPSPGRKKWVKFPSKNSRHRMGNAPSSLSFWRTPADRRRHQSSTQRPLPPRHPNAERKTCPVVASFPTWSPRPLLKMKELKNPQSLTIQSEIA
ncbi:hypothetical protein C9890_0358 [Perkinsus sp. BL_2016]|nr:hypothetical protein C9890_0358 [Perkinsus sp. BL_2016]